MALTATKQAQLTGPTFRRVLAQTAVSTIAEFRQQHGGWVAWSGGKDSTVTAVLAAKSDPDIPIVRLAHPGLEYPEVPGYCDMIAERFDLNYHLVTPEHDDGQWTSLLDWMEWSHWLDMTQPDRPEATAGDWHDFAIGQAREDAATHFGDSIIWGLRTEESRIRLLNWIRRGDTYQKQDGGWRCQPIIRWTVNDVWAAHGALGIPVCPVYDRLRELGAPPDAQRIDFLLVEGLCSKGGGSWLREGWPEIWMELTSRLPDLTAY